MVLTDRLDSNDGNRFRVPVGAVLSEISIDMINLILRRNGGHSVSEKCVLAF